MARSDRQMYLYGRRESIRDHRNPEHDDLGYWDMKLGGEPNYTTAFLDGWTDAATGENEYAHLYK